MKLNVLTWNTLFLGRDGHKEDRTSVQIEVINSLRPDVFLMQEADGYESIGSKLLYDLESRIGMRGFLAKAPRTGQNVAIFIRDPLTPISFIVDEDHFHHALATLEVRLPGLEKALTFICAHLSPIGPTARKLEVSYLLSQADPNQLILLAGDFNSISPHDADPAGLLELAPHHRSRYFREDLKTVDRSVLATLEAAGWVDLGNQTGFENIPTVSATDIKTTGIPTMRSDYMMASLQLSKAIVSFEVVVNPLTIIASDHNPIFATFNLD